jgi:hypothetical protein
VRREQDHRLALMRLQVFLALQPDQALDALRRGPPPEAEFQQAAAEDGEVPSRQRRLFGIRQLRKAQAEVDQRDAPAFAHQGV